MGELPIFMDSFSTFAVRNDVVHSAVVERMNLVLAQLTRGRLVIQVFSKLEIEVALAGRSESASSVGKAVTVAPR
jgi:hypothetical protein